jgi:hypothetical protein
VLHEERITALDGEMAERAKGDEGIKRLRSVPGVGPKIAFAFSAYVNGERFENGGQVSNYLGLTPGVYMSGRVVRYGGIAKGETGICGRCWCVGDDVVEGGRGAKGAVRVYDGGEREGEEEGDGGDSAAAGGAALYTLLKNGTGYEARHFRSGKPDVESLALKTLSA